MIERELVLFIYMKLAWLTPARAKVITFTLIATKGSTALQRNKQTVCQQSHDYLQTKFSSPLHVIAVHTFSSVRVLSKKQSTQVLCS
ncbi:hypothetical protein M758_9G149500 [Ceratodon purpureus]|uniref:Secreted protein n=1 Tax=Ceratodon purpureus TaxID=3225 RepID=A0A8T0GUZ5_CERPU|nr:hypothetical protein KC19_9G142200 [Ceratodon purpureus]KAG0606543.1 hypothetical protein M758_9G149500 [Ceratodon purpureus]